MNVIKDEIFTGPVLKLTNNVLAFVKTQIKEHTYLGADGRFKTDEQYPEFCWTEICVNAICHRDYSILGTDIQVKLFDDHMTVESPGILPGLVRPYNIREMHFSRNPKIALYMRNHKLVKEFGEGVDRMFREMEEAGCPAPEYRQNGFMVYATIRQREGTVPTEKTTEKTTEKILGFISENPKVTTEELARLCGLTPDGVYYHTKHLREKGLLIREGGRKEGYWIVVIK